MKVCPNCKAEIQEEARFCLYCMTSFEKKQPIEPPKERRKRLWPFLVVGAVLALIGAGLVLFLPKHAPSETPSETPTTAKTTETSDVEMQTTTAFRDASPSHTTSVPDAVTDATASPTTVAPAGTTASAPTDTAPRYQYDIGTMDNIGYYGVRDPEDTVVITKVDYIEPSGVYVIPQTIDGKKVAAIMPYAFSDPAVCATVRAVTLPSTVRMVWGSAFENCVNLTDLYLQTPVVEIEETAFPQPAQRNALLTVHCARDCRNFDFYYYRNIVSKYSAAYEEWKG
ncbi:MAG: hypothetical protein IJB27_07675 [Clostridia bacterium]|nr:hypothetical protein [Clostridia bacterium]